MNLQEILKYQANLYAETINNFDKMYDGGRINDEEYNALKTNAFLEYQARLAEISDIEEEDIDSLLEEDDEYEDEEALATYSEDNEDIAEFSVGNRFGAALLELGQAAGYEELEDYVEDLAEATGNDEDDIYDLVTGEAVPDDELALGISELFELDEDLTADLLVAGIEARGEDIEDYLDLDDEDEEEEYDDANDDTVAEEAPSTEAEYRLAEVEDELAEFKYNSTIKDALDQLMYEAADLVDAGYMPPSTFETLFSSFELDSDRIAAFSQTCEANEVSPATELYALEKIVDIFRRMPPTVDFGYMVEEDYVSNDELEEEAEMAAIAENYVRNSLR